MAGERKKQVEAEVDVGEVLAAVIPIVFAVGGILVALGAV